MADLSGTWLGTYWQRGEPTRFEATMVQAGNTLSGNILDDSSLGEAQFSGTVIGRKIDFTKHYLVHSQGTIHYSGTVSEDEDHIQGQWQIGWFDSGSWEAHRSGENLTLSVETRQTVQL